MKKIIYFGILVLLSTNVFAQYPNWGSVINPGGVSIGAPSGLTNFSDAALHIRARNNTSYPSGAGQQLFFAETRSAFGDNIRIFNGSGSNANIFAPILMGTAGNHTSSSLHFMSNAVGARDVGNSAMMKFSTRLNFSPNTSQETGNNGSIVNNRPLFEWTNYNQIRMKMLANGFLGINKATPEARLHINGNMRLRTSDNIVFGENSTGGVGEWITNSRQGTLFNAYGLAFYGNFKERMRIEAATGDVGIGVNDPTHRLHVVDTPNDDPVRIQYLQDRDDPFVVTIDTRGVLHRKRFNLNNAAILNCNTPNNVPRVTATGVLSCSQITDTGVGTVGINASGDFAYSPSLMLNHSWIHGPIGTGNPTNFKLNVGGVARANAIYLYSDEKYKRDVLDMENSLEVISRLKPKTYTWNDEAQEKFSTDDARHIGFIAQELMEVIPEIVVKDNESDLSVNYIELIPILVGAIKEQQKQINELKSRFVKSSNIKPENEIGNIDDASSLSIYPSPSKNSFTATISNATIKSVQIISISGQVIYSADFNQDRSEELIDVSKFSSGIYFVNVIDNNKKRHTAKLVKE